MAFAAPNVGEVLLLRYMLNNLSTDNVRLHLYSNNIDPSESDTIGSYTECTASGYASISLTGSLWTVTTVLNTTSATFPTQTFTFSTSQSVRGYYVTNNASSQVLMAESFDGGAFNIPTSGGQVQIDPVIILE